MRFGTWVWLRRRLVIWLVALAAISWRKVREQRRKQTRQPVSSSLGKSSSNNLKNGSF
jgi:hypothetical protein